VIAEFMREKHGAIVSMTMTMLRGAAGYFNVKYEDCRPT
jgi:hypothetical protein